MTNHQNIVVLITLILATAFLFIWKRRDAQKQDRDKIVD